MLLNERPASVDLSRLAEAGRFFFQKLSIVAEGVGNAHSYQGKNPLHSFKVCCASCCLPCVAWALDNE